MRGGLPPVPQERLIGNTVVEGAGINAILAFAIVAALEGKFDKLNYLELEIASEMGSVFVGRSVFRRFRSEGAPGAELDETIVRIFGIMKTGQHLDPADMTGVALRFTEFAYASQFRRELLPLLLSWFDSQVRRILDTQRFRLKSPILTVPEIENALQFAGTVEQRLAALLQAACEATGISLAQPYRDLLAERKKPRPKEEEAAEAQDMSEPNPSAARA
jgi:hypothetical protein